MNSQHYFKKLDKFAVCAFQAQKGCIEVELKSKRVASREVGVERVIFSCKLVKGLLQEAFQSEFDIVKKGDFFDMKDYLYQPRIYEALEDVYVWGFNTFPNQDWDGRLLTDETFTVDTDSVLICLDGKPVVNDITLRRFDYSELSTEKSYDVKLGDGVIALFTRSV